jgi:Uma2 family endonuclease
MTRVNIEPAASALEVYEQLGRVEHLHVELLFGRVVVTRGSSNRHACMVSQLRMVLVDLVRAKGWSMLHSHTIHIEPTGDRPMPDLLVMPPGAPAYDENELYGHGVPLVAEIVEGSYAADDQRDKAEIYAEGGVPLYLLVDIEDVTLFSDPVDGKYETEQTVPFGGELALPEPFGIVLDTAGLLVE